MVNYPPVIIQLMEIIQQYRRNVPHYGHRQSANMPEWAYTRTIKGHHQSTVDVSLHYWVQTDQIR